MRGESPNDISPRHIMAALAHSGRDRPQRQFRGAQAKVNNFYAVTGRIEVLAWASPSVDVTRNSRIPGLMPIMISLR
jgi:hypothetical protein